MRRLTSSHTADAFHHVSRRITVPYQEDLALGTVCSSCDPIDGAWHIRLPDSMDDFYVRSRVDPTVSEEQWREWEAEDAASGLEVVA